MHGSCKVISTVGNADSAFWEVSDLVLAGEFLEVLPEDLELLLHLRCALLGHMLPQCLVLPLQRHTSGAPTHQQCTGNEEDTVVDTIGTVVIRSLATCSPCSPCALYCPGTPTMHRKRRRGGSVTTEQGRTEETEDRIRWHCFLKPGAIREECRLLSCPGSCYWLAPRKHFL